MRQISHSGRKTLAEIEGTSSDAYQDVADFWTIGVGHALTRDEMTSGKILINGEAVRWRQGLTARQIEVLLVQDLEVFEMVVEANVIPMLTEWQFDALVSFAFNVGARAFTRSTLLRRVNERRYTEVPEQMRRWIYAGGRAWDGLVTRREVEIEQWSGAWGKGAVRA